MRGGGGFGEGRGNAGGNAEGRTIVPGEMLQLDPTETLETTRERVPKMFHEPTV